jgi:murein DD-endopeptidase MepM/ murein hydrolase activator NlpD
MALPLTRITGAVAAAATAGALVLIAPAASASPATASVATSASTPTAASVVPAGERNRKVSRSLRGVRASAYIGKYYNSRFERTRRCIVRRESGGNYRISSPGGRYRGAYQFNAGLARATARKMGRKDLAGKPISSWSRFEQDKAFWVVWNHGRGAGHWRSTRHRC